MDISINAEVVCVDGSYGHVSCVLINPVSKKVTHLVVKEHGLISVGRTVPIEMVTESTPEKISLRCKRADVSRMDNFIDDKYIRSEDEFNEYLPEQYYLHPFVIPDYVSDNQLETNFVEVGNIPPGELAVHHGANVYDSNNLQIGKIDEFLVSPKNEMISHMVLREGHLWGQKHVTIPVSEIDHIEMDGVHLNLTKTDVEKLPVIPIHRFWA